MRSSSESSAKVTKMVKQSAWHILPFWQRDARRERRRTPRGRCKADARRWGIAEARAGDCDLAGSRSRYQLRSAGLRGSQMTALGNRLIGMRRSIVHGDGFLYQKLSWRQPGGRPSEASSVPRPDAPR
jgi:hypothetical protein